MSPLCLILGHSWQTVGTQEMRPLSALPYVRLCQECARCGGRRVLESVPDTRVEWEKWVAGDREELPPGVTPV